MSDEKWIIDSDHTMEGYFKDQMYEPGREEIEAFIKDMEGNIIEGDAENVVPIVDIWTFCRDVKRKDPNWTLVSTSEA